MAHSTEPPIVSAKDFEREIMQEFNNRPPFRLPQSDEFAPMVGAPAMAMPDYVEHRDGATEIGKLSAEAVVREYEAAAKEIEAMGTELMDLVKHCEANTQSALAVSEELKETAARYRDEAKRVFLQIENCSLVTAEVRKTCNELMDKISRPAALDAGTKTKKK
jgi:phosphoglycolate phosphatase-like HAD superfamily hydrolase